MEMQKRRERIEQWRAERKKKQELIPINIAPASKKWSLEDEDDDDEEEVQEKMEENDDEVDPLDAYMQVCIPCWSLGGGGGKQSLFWAC